MDTYDCFECSSFLLLRQWIFSDRFYIRGLLRLVNDGGFSNQDEHASAMFTALEMHLQLDGRNRNYSPLRNLFKIMAVYSSDLGIYGVTRSSIYEIDHDI